jgi:hypothetical protein
MAATNIHSGGEMSMRPRISIKQGMEMLASHGGLIHIGTLLDGMKLAERLDQIPGVRCDEPAFSHSDILFSMLALITIGKPDYDAIELFRKRSEFFTRALGISACPASPTIRQRIDLIGQAADPILKSACAELVKSMAPAITAIETCCGPFLPLDIDVSPFDNSKTKKEGVGRTYKGCDGYAPIFAYLGTEGYLLNLELRQGTCHCQKNTPEFIDQSLAYVRQVTDRPVLIRMDAGNDSQDNFPKMQTPGVQFIIKRNLRRESRQAWLDLARAAGEKRVYLNGNIVWTGKTTMGIDGGALPYPIVFQITERNSRKGQKLMFPEIEVDSWWCSHPEMPADEVIRLYHDHGTSEQFHAELKSDMGLERLPSGRFASNALILLLGALAYNMMRIIGQQSLLAMNETDKDQMPRPRQKKVTRRRIRTVMQDLMYMAGRLIHTGRRWLISLGQMNPLAELWVKIDRRLRAAPAIG